MFSSFSSLRLVDILFFRALMYTLLVKCSSCASHLNNNWRWCWMWISMKIDFYFLLYGKINGSIIFLRIALNMSVLVIPYSFFYLAPHYCIKLVINVNNLIFRVIIIDANKLIKFINSSKVRMILLLIIRFILLFFAYMGWHYKISQKL